MEVITDNLFKMNAKNSIGHDGLSLRIVKLSAPLTTLFNYCIRSGTFPSDCQMSNVIPIPKEDEVPTRTITDQSMSFLQFPNCLKKWCLISCMPPSHQLFHLTWRTSSRDTPALRRWSSCDGCSASMQMTQLNIRPVVLQHLLNQDMHSNRKGIMQHCWWTRRVVHSTMSSLRKTASTRAGGSLLSECKNLTLPRWSNAEMVANNIGGFFNGKVTGVHSKRGNAVNSNASTQDMDNNLA